MASFFYDKALESFAKGEIDWVGDTIRAVLVDTGVYAVDKANDQFYDPALTGAVVGSESGAFSGKTAVGGLLAAADITFAAVSGATVEAIVVFQDTGTATTDRLLAYIDTGTGLPFTPSGADQGVAWPIGGVGTI